MTNLNEKLSKAKTALILDHPFVGMVALSMPFELTDAIPTAATNGERVLFNPNFVAGLSDEETKFLIAHECLHPMLEHNWRRQGRSPRKWNIAADFVINKLLIDEGIGKMPSMGLYSPEIYEKGSGTAEGIYAILPDQNEDTQSLDDCEDAEGSPAEQAQQKAEWQVKLAQAAQAAKMMGRFSTGMQRLVNEVLAPKVDWRDVLQRFLVKAKTDERSFARFNRRFLPQRLYLPSQSGETMGEIVIAVDCSGSVDDATLAQFAAEIRSIKDELLPKAVHVIYFDSAVCHIDTFELDDYLEIRPYGGGGTDYAPVFEAIIDNGFDPVAVVFLTDLCCTSFGTAPDVPVLWVSTDAGEAPFGEVVRM